MQKRRVSLMVPCSVSIKTELDRQSGVLMKAWKYRKRRWLELRLVILALSAKGSSCLSLRSEAGLLAIATTSSLFSISTILILRGGHNYQILKNGSAHRS